jgi:hypothetical protein
MPEEPPHFSRAAERLIADLRGVPDTDPRRQKLRPTRELAGVIDELVTKYQIGRESPEQVIRDHWTELVGPANAAYSHAARLEQDGRKLVVLAAHAVVRNELFFHRDTLLERVRQLPGCRGIKLIQLRAG